MKTKVKAEAGKGYEGCDRLMQRELKQILRWPRVRPNVEAVAGAEEGDDEVKTKIPKQ